jgi:hypothetical protein
MKSVPGLAGFTLIPMMTGIPGKPESDTGTKSDLEKAVKTGKAGSQNTFLLRYITHLQSIESDPEYIDELRHYFKNENIPMEALHPQTFTHKERGPYFKGVLEKFPKKSLVLLDPDVGLEESKSDQRHLLFSEVKLLHSHLDTASALLIYQHFPRKDHEEFTRQRCSKLSSLTGCSPLTITDKEHLFFLITKSQEMQEHLDRSLENYANSYPALSSCCWK